MVAVVDDVVGLLLDLDAGSLSVFKNRSRLGVMVAEGLSGGPLCWAALLPPPVYTAGGCTRIASAPAPASG